MKKSLNFLLILSLVCFGLTLAINFCSITFHDVDLFPITSEVVDTVQNAEEGDPGAGWLLVLFTPFSIIGDFTLVFLVLFAIVLIPLWCCGVTIILQVAARLFQIGGEKNWKDIVGKVLTVSSIVIQILLCIVLLICLISPFDVSKIILFVSFVINVTSVVLFIREFIKMSKTKEQVMVN